MNIQRLSKYLTMAAFAGAMTCGAQLYAQTSGSMPSQSGQSSQAPDAQQPSSQAPGAYGQTAPGAGQSGQMGAGAQAGQSGMGNSSATATDPSGGQMIVGTVVKSGDKYQLKEDSSGQLYDIDHQSEVSKFEGKRVRVRGTVDPATKTIHLQ
jgi:hypothetical protein